MVSSALLAFEVFRALETKPSKFLADQAFQDFETFGLSNPLAA